LPLPLLIALALALFGCPAAGKNGGKDATTVNQITIDANTRFQTIAGFSASDCWMVNYVGKHWNEPEKETLARWLFSRGQNDDGSPEGIGLSMWRFNLGAGTFEQGDDSGIPDLPRRAESFLADIYRGGTYDWSKQAGQQFFLYKARDYGVEQVVLFSNSPPVAFTKNGKGFADKGGSANLRDNAYNDFAAYMADVAAHFRQEGIPVTYISPVNEPQYNWDGNSQEGSPWSNGDIARLARELDREIQARGLDTKILLTEAGAWNSLFEKNGRATEQTWAFFDTASPDYIGGLSSMPRMLGSHSLWSHGTDRILRSTRSIVRKAADKYDLELFQTEWSMLQGGDGLPADINSASYFDMALFMGKIIHADMVYANAASWSFWTSMDMDRHSLKNRYLLIMLDPASEGSNTSQDGHHPILDSGRVEARSTLWVLGNYSYFIRPGYTRIALTGADDLGSLMGSAYISPDGGRIVAVYVNMDGKDHQAAVNFHGLRAQPQLLGVYITAEGSDLKKAGPDRPFNKDEKLIVPARSVLTAVYDLPLPPPGLLDEVITGDPESEYEHRFEGSNSRSGYNNGGYWRDADGDEGGFYQYTLATGGETNLVLQALYWGNDSGDRTFDIYIDDQHLANENIVGKWQVDDFVNAEYPIPPEMAAGKKSVTVKFQSTGGNTAGGIYGLRLGARHHYYE